MGLSTLKDKSLPWKQRLTLALDLWMSEKYVPRKEQVIIDWLTFTLHSSTSKGESLTSEEKQYAWQTLAKILTSKEVQKISNDGDAITISLWFYNDIQSEIEKSEHTSHVLDCLLAISSEKCFKTFNYLSLDNLVDLLHTCCLSYSRVCSQSMNSETSASWSLVLTNLTNRLRVSTDRRTFPVTLIAAFANKLLVPVVSVYTCLAGSSVAHLLLNTVIYTLTHRDALKHYERYLKENKTTASGSETTPAQKRENFVDVVFMRIGEGLSSDEEVSRKSYLHVLSTLYEFYLNSCKDSTFKMDKGGMLYALMKLTEGMESKADKVNGWALLLSLAASYEIHNVTSEEASKELAALSRTVADLLINFCSTADWYRCLSAILDINHKCVEKRLSQVLDICWQKAPKLVEGEMEEVQAKLLKSLLSVYNKLRQLPKIVNAMVECVIASGSPKPLPALALRSLGELITTSPPTLCYDLWLSLYTKVMDQTGSISDECSCLKCLACADILHTIMYHMKVYDSNAPLSVRTKLSDSLGKMQAELSKEIKQCKQNLSTATLKAPILLLVLDGCSAMTILLYHYVSPSIDVSPQLTLEAAIQLVHSMISQGLANETMHLLQLISVRLYCHWMSFLELSSDKPSACGEQINACITKILAVWSNLPLDSLQPWSGTMLGATHENITTVIVSHMSRTSALTYIAHGSADAIEQFTSLLVNTGVNVYNHINNCTCCNETETLRITTGSKHSKALQRQVHHMGCYEEYQLLIKRYCTVGHSTLYTSLVQKVVMELVNAFAASEQCEPTRSKKRKLNKVKPGSSNKTVDVFFQVLKECIETGSCSSERLCEVSNHLLAMPKVVLTSAQLCRLLLTTQVLQNVPLRGIDSATQGMMFYLSLGMVKLVIASNNLHGDKSAILRPHTLLLCQLMSSLSTENKLMQTSSIEFAGGLFGQLPTNVGSCKAAVIDELVAMLCTNEVIFMKSKSYLDKLLDRWMSSDVVDKTELQLPLGVARVVFQSGAVKPLDIVVSWVMERSNALLDSIVTGVANSQPLNNDLLSWCSLVMSTHRKLHHTSDMSALTSLVVREIGNVVSGESANQLSTAEPLLYYITCAAGSTQRSQHLSGIDIQALWRDVVVLGGRGEVTSSVSRVVSSMVTSMDVSTLSACLGAMRVSMQYEVQSTKHLPCLVNAWSCVMSMAAVVDKDKQVVIETHCHQLIVDSQAYISQLCDIIDGKTLTQQVKDSKPILTDLINLLGLIVGKGKTYCTSQGISSILLGVQLLNYSKYVYCVSDLMEPLSATQRLLRSVLLHHQTAANNNLHVYSAICTRLVNTVITFADQNIAVDSDSSSLISETETELLACCQELHKVFSTMADYPKIFSKVSSFILADVVHSLTSITLLPNVKKALYLSVNGLFDAMDVHCEVMLKVNLNEACREVYKTMQGQYSKYHKYTGKV